MHAIREFIYVYDMICWIAFLPLSDGETYRDST